jgi:hypothetical protein
MLLARANEVSEKRCYLLRCSGRYWHLADNPVASAFVRFWTKADKVGFWPATVCPLMTQSGHFGTGWCGS